MNSIEWITLALAAVLAASAYAADEEGKLEYTIYGQAHLSVENLDDGADSSQYLSNNGSRLGFKGDVTLAEELKLIWQIESSVELDDTGRELATRNSFAGLQGIFGTILAGRYDSPFKQAGRKADLFGYRLGDSRNIIGINTCGCDLRLDNVILYKSPNMKGLSAQVARTTEDGTDDTDVTSLNAIYDNGTLLVGAGYEEHGTMLSPVDTDDDGETDSPSEEGEAGVRLVGSYKVGNARITGLYENLLDVGGTAGADRPSWGCGVSYAVGQTVLTAQYYATDGVNGRPDSGAATYALGWDYNISKKTTVYVAYANTDNDENAAYKMTGGAHGEKVTPATGNDPSGIALGLIHNF